MTEPPLPIYGPGHPIPDPVRTEGGPTSLRVITYLAPGLPLALFEVVADHLARALPGYEVHLSSEERTSGPARGAPDPFSSGEADVGFLCAPSYLWLREREPPPAHLLGVAPLFADARNGGRPVYFCDVVVPRESPVRAFSDLRGRVWAYNDASSLSGYRGMLLRLGPSESDAAFFGRTLESGSHLASVAHLLDGSADAASIDSNSLNLMMARQPSLREGLRVIESWGPYPVQPVVVRSGLGPELEGGLRASLLDAAADPLTRRGLEPFGLSGFAPVGEEDYTREALLSSARGGG